LQRHLAGDLEQLFDKTDLIAKALFHRLIVCSLRYLACVLGRDVQQQDRTKDLLPCLRLSVDDPGAQLDLVGLLEGRRRQACRCSRVSLRPKANYI
ncbi:hypothetical protein, partial [Bradyrhizobium sp.]|uniref:hypothetical protein n=1 Tax=Bradyrhizobium sp. TaxID=376 RepID=UPI002728DFF4